MSMNLRARIGRLERRTEAARLPPLPDLAFRWDDGSMGWIVKDGECALSFEDGGPGEAFPERPAPDDGREPAS